MNIPTQIKVVENRLGEKNFIIRERTLCGGMILLLFASVWLSVLFLMLMEFLDQWVFGWKSIAIGFIWLGLAGIGLGIFYLGLYCWFGTVQLKISHGIFYFFSGIFGIGRRVNIALTDIQEVSIIQKERRQQCRTMVDYHLALKLTNGRQEKIPFADDHMVAKFFKEYLQERI